MIRSVFNNEVSRPQGGACGAHAGQKATAGSERVLPFFFPFSSEIIACKGFQEFSLTHSRPAMYTKNKKYWTL
jgi:hypothetical protein